LKTATRNFNMMNCIGRGGFGAVYKVRTRTCLCFFSNSCCNCCFYSKRPVLKISANIIANQPANMELLTEAVPHLGEPERWHSNCNKEACSWVKTRN
jgi:hypothetical protein